MKARYFKFAHIAIDSIIEINPNGQCYWVYLKEAKNRCIHSKERILSCFRDGTLEEIAKPEWITDAEAQPVTRTLWALKDKKTGKYETYIPRLKTGLLTDACLFYSRRIARYFKKDNTTIVKIQATLKETK